MKYAVIFACSLVTLTFASSSFAVCPPPVEVSDVTVEVEPALDCFEVDVSNERGCREDVLLEIRNRCDVSVTHTTGVEGMHEITNMRCGEMGERQCVEVLSGESAYAFLPVEDSMLDIPFTAGDGAEATEHVVSAQYTVTSSSSSPSSDDSGCSTSGGSPSPPSAVALALLALIAFRRRA